MRVRRRGKSWYLHWWDEAARRERRVSLGPITKREAEAMLAVKRAERATGKLVLSTLRNDDATRLSGFVERYLEWRDTRYPASAYESRLTVERQLVPAFGDQCMEAITKRDADVYRARRLAEARPGTVNKELRTLRAILNKAVEWEVITGHKLAGLDCSDRSGDAESKPVRFLTSEELEAIYAADPEYAPVFSLMANTGLRRGEAVNLSWGDVKPDHLMVVSREGARTKSGRWRKVPLSPAARTALERLADRATEPPWTAKVLERVHKDSLTRRFRRAAERAGLEDAAHLHCLRHTFCSHLIMAGVPLRTVQQLAGHASFSTTEIYAHLAPEHLADAVSNLNL